MHDAAIESASNMSFPPCKQVALLNDIALTERLALVKQVKHNIQNSFSTRATNISLII